MKSKPCGSRLGVFGAGAFAALVLSACGGGGVISGPPVLNCTSTTGSADGFSMGTCSSATAVKSLRQAINAAVTIAPGQSSYTVGLGALGTHTMNNPADLSRDGSNNLLNTLGAVRGLYLQRDFGGGAYAAIGDFSNARDHQTDASKWGAGALSYTNFGLWERFVSASEGYYGGWFVPRSAGDANPTIPTTGSATYDGVVVGALAPLSGNPPLYGLSGAISLTANFTANTVSGTMSGFALSNQILGVGSANIANVTMNGSIAPAGFSGTMSGGGSGAFEGAFFGAQPAGRTGPAEVAGRFHFLTPDARQVVGAFGARQ